MANATLEAAIEEVPGRGGVSGQLAGSEADPDARIGRPGERQGQALHHAATEREDGPDDEPYPDRDRHPRPVPVDRLARPGVCLLYTSPSPRD